REKREERRYLKQRATEKTTTNTKKPASLLAFDLSRDLNLLFPGTYELVFLGPCFPRTLFS
ncbi:hypothetical protein, partial [Enterovibrio norvegicus]|uniref:hypothetical protein n=1 Tax=Enterovibrio norvegicus TaxID=188144 RepID=UPI001A7E163A